MTQVEARHSPVQPGISTRREMLPPSPDPAIRKLHQLTDTEDTKLFGFLNDLETSEDPAVEAVYGAGNGYTDRLAKVQSNNDGAFYLSVPGSSSGEGRDYVLVQVNTWAAKERSVNPHKGILNEDSPFIAPFGEGRLLAAVFDGASSRRPIPGLYEYGVSGAWYIAHLASLGFPNTKEYLDLKANPNTSAEEVMKTLNTWLKERLRGVEGVSYDDVIYIPGMAATMVLIDYQKDEISLAHVADTLAVAEYDSSFSVLTDDKNFQWDEMKRRLEDSIVNEELANGRYATRVTVKDDPRIKGLLEQSYRAKINSHPFGTGILNGQPELVGNGLIYTDTVPIPNDRGLKLHLVSDGVYSIWMGREDQPDLGSGVRKLLGALDNPSVNPRNVLSEIDIRVSLDPDGAILGRSNDDSSRVSIQVKKGTDSEAATEFRNTNRRLLIQDSAEIARAQVIRDAEKQQPHLPSIKTGPLEYMGMSGK